MGSRCIEKAREYTTNFYTGRLRLEVQPLTLLRTMFGRKGTPFVYTLLANGTPSQTYFTILYPFKLL